MSRDAVDFPRGGNGEVAARNLAAFPLTPNPRRGTMRASFDTLSGNSTLSILVTEAGVDRRGHRHLDEATTVILSGSGWTEFHQDDDGPAARVEWSPGDIFAVPSNVWHRHYGRPPSPARQLTFKNTPLIRNLFGSRAFLRDNPFRFTERYDDGRAGWEPLTSPTAAAANWVRAPLSLSLPRQPQLGADVRAAKLSLAGQRVLETWLVDVPTGDGVRSSAPPAEEAFFVLSGQGRTYLHEADGGSMQVPWSAGDLVSPPLGASRRHAADGPDPARIFLVRNVVMELAFGRQRAERLATQRKRDEQEPT